MSSKHKYIFSCYTDQRELHLSAILIPTLSHPIVTGKDTIQKSSLVEINNSPLRKCETSPSHPHVTKHRTRKQGLPNEQTPSVRIECRKNQTGAT